MGIFFYIIIGLIVLGICEAIFKHSSTVTGRVTHLQKFRENDRGLKGAHKGSHKVCTFRVAPLKQKSRQQPSVQVEMRGQSFTGDISNGDVVSVNRQKEKNGVLKVNELENKTTGATVKAHDYPLYAQIGNVFSNGLALLINTVIIGGVILAVIMAIFM